MKNGLKRTLAVASAVAMLGCAFSGLAACQKDDNNNNGNDTVTYRTYTSVVPSLWNELDSMDENNNQIMDYLSSAFYEFDYEFDESKGGKFNADGSINAAAIVDGSFEVKYSAATKLEDVTAEYADAWGYSEEEAEKGGYAWKVTLRDDLKWNDGTAIDATDFVYSMEQQLDPKFAFKRASSYYGALSVKGAKNFVYQGQSSWYGADAPYDEYTEDLDDALIFSLGSAEENKDRGGATASVRTYLGAPDAYPAESMAAFVASYAGVAKADVQALEGKTFAEIKADDDLKATWDAVIGWWQTEPNEELHFFVTQYTWPEYEFDDVGVFSPSKYEIVVCFTTSESLLKEDGSLSYLAAYELANLPLVKKDLFESCIVAPSEGATLYTSTYNTTLETSASWGPYMLTEYQSGKGYTLEKNPYWYGYSLEDNANQYAIEKITCEAIAETDTQWMKMLNGEIDAIGIDVTRADDYRNSKYTYYTPGTYTFSWHLFSDLDTLKDSGRNNGILAIKDFREALSLSIDRDAYAAANTAAYRGTYGYLNSMYYYDVEEGGVYRNTDAGKKAILRAYGYVENENGTWTLDVEGSLIKNYSLDDAYETVTGYNLSLAKEALERAYEELTANSEYYGYDPNKNIEIKFGTSVDNDSTRREYNYIKDTVLPALLNGTSLEGKIDLVFDASFGDEWSDSFMAGQYELCTSAWGSAAFDPFYFIGAYVDPDNAYTASYWDTESVEMTMTLPGEEGEFDGAGEELTMTVMNWYRCLNGYEIEDTDKYDFDWSAGKIPAEYRLEVLAALEEFVLTQYYSIPTITQNSATLVGAKFSYISDDYNTFMGYGGIRYRIVNYNDAQWDAFVASQGGNLETLYKMTA